MAAAASAVAVGAELAAKSAEESVPAPFATIDPPALEVATDAAATVATAAVATASATASVVEVGCSCAAVSLLWSVRLGVGGRRSACADAAALSVSRPLIVAAAIGRLVVIAASSLKVRWRRWRSEELSACS